jgi:hypothetical protein
MKKVILIPLFVLTTAITMAQSSNIRLNLYSSYVFDDGFDVYNDANTYFNGSVKGGLQWGGSIEYLPHPAFSVELMYLNRSTTVPATFKFGVTEPKRTEDFEMGLDYILVGFNRLQKSSSGKVEGYLGLLLGAVMSDVKSPSTDKSGSNTDFTWGGKLGLNYWISDKIGIKLQSQVLAAAKVTGGDQYWSYWGPVYLNEYSSMWQFGLGGGLTFRFGK